MQTGISLGELEARAGITDRAAFWLQFADRPDGYEQGVARLREMARDRIEAGSFAADLVAAGPDRTALTLFAIAAVNLVAALLVAGGQILGGNIHG